MVTATTCPKDHPSGSTNSNVHGTDSNDSCMPMPAKKAIVATIYATSENVREIMLSRILFDACDAAASVV